MKGALYFWMMDLGQCEEVGVSWPEVREENSKQEVRDVNQEKVSIDRNSWKFGIKTRISCNQYISIWIVKDSERMEDLGT